MGTALELNHVWKKFHRGEINDCLRDAIPAFVKGLCGFGPKRSELDKKDFWALADINFKVEEGETLGIIGHNGAGKSTLLKILSNIIEPNRGNMRVNGRLRSLIEIGAGFHGDLTGRENIFLNGAILGMTRQEIQKNFDSIVDFSGVEAFLDTPVKRYSSGMAARLGFAVAAHLEPEILIVDEVLSVGDSEFQKKCLGKMSSVAGEGRTVLFVSHNMGAVRQLCSRSILLEKGRMIAEGKTEEVIYEYVGRKDSQAGNPIAERTDRAGTGDARVLDVKVGTSPEMMGSESYCDFGAELYVQVRFSAKTNIKNPVISVAFVNSQHEAVSQVTTFIRDAKLGDLEENCEKEVQFVIPNIYMIPGRYSLYVGVGNDKGVIYDYIPETATLGISPQNQLGFHLETGRWCYRALFPYEWREL